MPLVGPIFASVKKDYPDLVQSRTIHEAVRRLIGAMVEDLLAETRGRIGDAKASGAEDIRRLGHPVAGFSPAMEANEKSVKAFLFENMYRHNRVNRMTSEARRVVRELFEIFKEEPECLPTDWRGKLDNGNGETLARVVADYIAGMTDRFAQDEHQRLYGPRSRTA